MVAQIFAVFFFKGIFSKENPVRFFFLGFAGKDAWNNSKRYSLKWWFDGDLPWWKVNNNKKNTSNLG